MTYLHELQDNAKNPASGAMLMPNCGELPRRVCRMCENYREGGICAEASRGTTSALEPADDKRCFVPRGTDAMVQPAINDTPEVRHAAESRREKKAEAPATQEEKKAKRAESDRKYYEKVKAKQAEADATNDADGVRVCQRCGRTLPLEEFQVNKHGTRFHACRECMHEAHVKGGSTGGVGRPKKQRLTYTQQLAQRETQEQPVTDRRKKYATEEERRAARLASKRESNKRRYERIKAAVAEQAKAEQVQRTIDKARDKALALGLDKVAQCLGEAAAAMAELAKIPY